MADEIDVLLARVEDDGLRQELAAHVGRLKQRRRFGLVFEDHLPESVALPQHQIRRGLKVVPRDDQTCPPQVVTKVKGKIATLTDGQETSERPVNDLVVVAEFGEPIYPGLKQLGSIERGGDKPAHVVIKGENYHALEALQFTHAGKVDCIYIDPPYNTGARDWKYNNDYVDGDDAYRHSKWLAFMERRLKLTKALLRPDDSVLIVAIDEKEYLRLGMLLEQLFPSARIQMVSTQVNPAVVSRPGSFGRSDEYIFFVAQGAAAPTAVSLSREWVSARGRTHGGKIRWDMFMRSGTGAARSDRPTMFYPVYVDPSVPKIVGTGESLKAGNSVAPEIEGLVAVLPIRKDGSEGRWTSQASTLMERVQDGRVRVRGDSERGYSFSVLKEGEWKKVSEGIYKVTGTRADGSIEVSDRDVGDGVVAVPGSQWRISSHDSTQYGTRLLQSLLPDRKFPFPKSLYAVEDALRFFVTSKPDALILDFFAGSGTTAHAVARLNHKDGGRRSSISVTNNEVSDAEANSLRKKGLLPGQNEWESQGIFEKITRPRLEAALTGKTPDGRNVNGDYKFVDEFPMLDGLEENFQFVELEYLDPEQVELDRAFGAIASLLWMRSGSKGPILSRPGRKGHDGSRYVMSEHYGVLFDTNHWRAFVDGLEETVTHAFIVTDSTSEFASVAAELPADVEAVRLYENYLSTFAINTGATL